MPEEESKNNKKGLAIAIIGAVAVILAAFIPAILTYYSSEREIDATMTGEAISIAYTQTESEKKYDFETITITPSPTSIENTDTPTPIILETEKPSQVTPTPEPTDIPPTQEPPTITPTQELIILFKDDFEEYEFSTSKWYLVTILDGMVYRRTITKDKDDNKFIHFIDCEPKEGASGICTGRNEIPSGEQFRDFKFEIDIEYTRIPPFQSGLYLPYVCINFRRYDEYNYYNLCLRVDSSYRWLRVTGNSEESSHKPCGSPIIGTTDTDFDFTWENSQLLKQKTERNKIRLTANGDEFLFEANDEMIAICKDDSLMSFSDIEIAINSFKNIPYITNDVELEFDNIVLIELP